MSHRLIHFRRVDPEKLNRSLDLEACGVHNFFPSLLKIKKTNMFHGNPNADSMQITSFECPNRNRSRCMAGIDCSNRNRCPCMTQVEYPNRNRCPCMSGVEYPNQNRCPCVGDTSCGPVCRPVFQPTDPVFRPVLPVFRSICSESDQAGCQPDWDLHPAGYRHAGLHPALGRRRC